MTAPYDRRSDVFTDWLDAQVTGKSTPDHELAADADLADLCAAADQFHGLAERLGQDATRVSPSTRSWEDIMATHPALLATASAAVSPAGTTAPSWWGGSARERFDRFATGALAAALVVAIGGGAWLAADGGPFGGNEPPATTSFGGFGPNDDNSRKLVPEVTVAPDDQMSSIPYPSAAECTVDLPDRAWVENHLQQTMTMTEQPPRELYQWPIEPTQDEIDGVMSTFRLWQACQLVGTARAQAFTLETPWMTGNMGMIWGMAEQPISDAEFTYLVDIAMAGSEEEQRAISNEFHDGTPGAPVFVQATPGATPMDGPTGVPGEQPVFAPYPVGATPVARSGATSAWPTIFADGIEMIGPDRASAQIFAVSPETGEVNISSGLASYVVELVRVDGVWLIDFYGEPYRG